MTHDELMVSLTHRHEQISTLVRGRRVHYVDVPMYGNVGDLLIMFGTLNFFEARNVQIASLATYFNFRPTRVLATDVIAFQGGGNFGDIYGPFQAFRERVIAQFPHHRLVVMPQSIHFSSDTALERCIAVCRAHPDLHIFVRDHESLAMATRMTPNAHLAPDMAHHLWPVSNFAALQPTQGSTLHLRRRDAEATGTAGTTGGQAFDWDEIVGPVWRFFLSQIVERSVTQAHLRFGIGALFGSWVVRAWLWQARRFMSQAIAVFARHERVESDRLHAHILSMLMSKANKISDNSYGKNSRYITSWTGASPLVTLQAHGPKVADKNA